MQTRFFYYFVLFVLIGCGKPDPTVQKEKLAGYWEIQQVTMPDGTKKEFGISTIVDFIEVSGNYGVRTKVSPKFDGSFVNNGSTEKFSLKIEQDSLRMYYETPYDSWKETVLVVEDSILKVKNKDHKIYTYKKFRKFNFDN